MMVCGDGAHMEVGVERCEEMGIDVGVYFCLYIRCIRIPSFLNL